MKKKVVHLVTSLNIGGTEKFLYELIKFQKQKYNVIVGYLKDSGYIGDEIKKLDIEIKKFSGFYGFLKLIYFIRIYKPDIVQTHLFRANVLGRIVSVFGKNNAVVISSQQSIDAWKKFWHWWLERFSARFAHRIIANSLAAKYVLVHYGKISEKKIDVVYIGINTTFVEPIKQIDIYQELNISHDKTIVSCIGRLHKEKGSHYIPQIIEETHRLYENIIFLIVGHGPLKKRIQKDITSKKIDKYVIMLDVRMDISNILRNTSVFFLPSLEESFAHSALEAMAMGKPVVITDVGGNAELVDDGINGFLLPPKEPKMMAQKISELCKNKERAYHIGINARKKAEQFTMHDTLKAIDCIYNKVLYNKEGL